MSQFQLPDVIAERRGILLGLLAMTFFSIQDDIWKYCLMAAPLAVVVSLSFLGTAFVLCFYAGVRRISLRPRNPRDVAVFAAFSVAEQLTFAYALGRVPMAELFVVILATPLFVLVCARLLLYRRTQRAA